MTYKNMSQLYQHLRVKMTNLTLVISLEVLSKSHKNDQN